MSVKVYDKDGKGHLIKPERLQAHLSAGWSVIKGDENVRKEKQQEEKAESEKADYLAELREKAKFAGIKGWHRMTEDTLREKLNGG
jgi:hypothetical protein